MQPNKPVVLVVDDDPVNLDILVQTLEQDYFLIIAKNGKRALDLAFSHHPDLILLDILMPEMDGFEVCQRLKADKETEGIPVIFLSAKCDIVDNSIGFRARSTGGSKSAASTM